jgi:hypothetical protein
VPSPDVQAAASTPACLSVPPIGRNQSAKVPGGGRLLLQVQQVDDPARPLLATVKSAGAGAIRSAAFKQNGHPIGAGAPSTVIPVGALKVGHGRNKLTVTVTLRNGKKITLTRSFAVQRCALPSVACQRIGDGHSLRCHGGTALSARRVKLTVTRSPSETATGSGPANHGHFTIVVHSRVALGPGRYAFKYVATGARAGQKFQVIRIVVVA